jgi:prefoldin subunit 5
MVSPEVASLTAVLKYIWAMVFVPVGAYLFKVQRDTDKRITILETRGEQIDKAIDENTAATKELTGIITQLRIDLASRDSKNHNHN